MKEVFFAASVRTPIGKFGGTLKDWTAADLAVPVVQESLRRAGLQPDLGCQPASVRQFSSGAERDAL